MQVILKKPVRKLGKIGQTITVADGYARNYLIPQNLALRATKDNINQFAVLEQQLKDKNVTYQAEAEAIATQVQGKHVMFVTQSAADGRLFGSVSAKSIAAELSKLAGVSLNYTHILLKTPIKFNGVYEVPVALHSDVISNILVVVAKTDTEAQDALRDYQEANKNTSIEQQIG